MKYRLAAIPKTAIIVVLGIFVSGGRLNCKDFLIVSLCCLLWTVLYAMNEAIDSTLEEKKQTRHWLMSSCLIGCACIAIGASLVGGGTTGILFLLMTASQIIYCWPGIRTKRFVWAGPLQSGLINPTLRFLIGVDLGFNTRSNQEIVLGYLALLLALHFAGALKTRVYQTSRDRMLGYQTFSIVFVLRFVEPLQFLTPICAGALVLLVYRTQATITVPTTARMLVIILVTTGILTIWAINDVYDRARHRLSKLLLYNYEGSLAQAELEAGNAIAMLETEAGVPSIGLLRGLWHLKLPSGLIRARQLSFTLLIPLMLPIFPVALVPLVVTVALTVYRAATRPQ